MRFTFATLEQAQNLMRTSDDYTQSLNAYNLNWANQSTTEAELLEKCAQACVAWTEGEMEKSRAVVAQFQSLLMDLDVNIDLEIILIKTNGSDCNHLPYTRQNFIVFPSSTFEVKEGEKDVSPLDVFSLGLLVHESFHVISRVFPQLRSTLYPFLGFTYPVDFNQSKHFPPQLVINPDAPHHNHVISVLHENREYLGTPVFEGFGKGTKLLLFNSEGVFKKIVKCKKTDYLKKIKAVSGYTIHPEEIAAEYFRVSITISDEHKPKSCDTFLSLLKSQFKVSDKTG